LGIIILAVTFALMWAFFIRPQQQRVRAHQVVVASLREGDEVITTAGIYGTVVSVDEEIVVLEIAPELTIRIARGAIGARRGGDADAEAEIPAEPADADPTTD
jgi:preprotein translocase subunit YajC